MGARPMTNDAEWSGPMEAEELFEVTPDGTLIDPNTNDLFSLAPRAPAKVV
jgi:hypothetical protein